jgi:hypothetical protein
VGNQPDVTDNREDARDISESGNRLAELEEEVMSSLGLEKPTDEERERRARMWEAKRTARICTECGGEIGDSDPVYRLRVSRPSVVGGMSNGLETFCEACAYGDASRVDRYVGFSLRRAMKMLAVQDAGGSQKEISRAGYGRDLIFDFCPICNRKVVTDTTKRDDPDSDNPRIFLYCCEAHAKRHHNTFMRRKPKSARECEVCGEEFKAKRVDARICSAACKQKAYRQRKKVAG